MLHGVKVGALSVFFRNVKLICLNSCLVGSGGVQNRAAIPQPLVLPPPSTLQWYDALLPLRDSLEAATAVLGADSPARKFGACYKKFEEATAAATKWPAHACSICCERYPGMKVETNHPTVAFPGPLCSDCIRSLENKARDDKQRQRNPANPPPNRNYRHLLLNSENDMFLDSDVPDCLSCLTYVERLLIARVACLVSVHVLKYGQHGFSQNVISFPQDCLSVAKTLPVLPESVQMLLVVRHREGKPSVNASVSKERIREALVWLQQHNPHYTDIIIDDDALESLPNSKFFFFVCVASPPCA